MEFIMGLGLTDMTNIVDIVKIFFLSMFTYYINFKLINEEMNFRVRNGLIVIICMMVIAIVCRSIKNILGFSYNLIFMVLLISVIFKMMTKQRFAYSILITVISLGINYIIFSLSVILTFIPTLILSINNIYVGLILIIVIYSVLIFNLYKIQRFKKGLIFLQENKKNDYMDILILNVSVVVLFCTIILSSYDKIIGRKAYVSFIILSIIMFITIQKSLQLYYKQKLQEREVEEIKEELKNKDKEIEELEKENLKLNKKNHSIAHKQKSLEYELEQMILNNQIVNGNQVKDQIENLSKEMQNETVSVELTKTNIDEIDSMLKYMQSECIKNKIEFELQINGNIHHMVNTYIGKEDLEILIADLIKNAIIAIKHSENINKSILVRLGLIDGFYSLYIYDSGIEFEIETLKNFGIKPSTTHADEGGTGMGLMNTFDTLKKSKASLIIDEYGKPVEDNFTKVIKIIFDNRNEYKIESYRKKVIEENNINKKIFQDKF